MTKKSCDLSDGMPIPCRSVIHLPTHRSSAWCVRLLQFYLYFCFLLLCFYSVKKKHVVESKYYDMNWISTDSCGGDLIVWAANMMRTQQRNVENKQGNAAKKHSPLWVFFQFNTLVNLLPQIKEAWCLGYDKGFQSNLALFSVNTI